MTALLQSLTANPIRAFLAAGLAALLALFALPMAAWLPGSLVVLGLLASGPGVAWAATAGAGFALVWAFSPLFGAAPALAAAIVMLLPAMLAAFALEKSRSLSFAFQALTLASCLLVFAIHGLLGDPVRALAPVIAELEPMLRQTADMFSRMGIQSSPEQIGAATARMAWATLAGWCCCTLSSRSARDSGATAACASRDSSGTSSGASGWDKSSPGLWSSCLLQASSRIASPATASRRWTTCCSCWRQHS
jgi:hypothetical protein